MVVGYLYCFSNESMPGIIMTYASKLEPEKILKKANKYCEWKPPSPYKIEIVKKVKCLYLKRVAINSMLSHLTKIHYEDSFFKVSVRDCKVLFDLLDDIDCKTDDDIATESDNESDNEYNNESDNESGCQCE
jgi:hypothetical protein